MTAFEPRPIGDTGIHVTPVAMGCWPITGITSVDVSEAAGLATLQAAVDAGINFFDTAYCYGYDGESERMIARALGHRRDEIVIASKAGLHWIDRRQHRDARPETIRRECDESLRRLSTDRIDLYYLHAPDPNTPLEETAGAFRELREAGKVRSVGVSNVTVEMLETFHAVCPLAACQPHYNMLQREIEADVLPWCVEHGVSLMVYWPLMKGLLAGKLARDHQFDPRDGRAKYPMFRGEEWRKNQDFLDTLRPIAAEVGRTVAQVVINWTIQQPGITAALCGAKRPEQIRDNAAAMEWKLSAEQLARIDRAIAERGPAVSRGAV
jgi:aryl-alcohol dehydrogenase-like predicted oxidoreductase